MNAIKMNISEKLVEGYSNVPPSLKDQTIAKLAIHLCQNDELKKDIIFEAEHLRMLNNCMKRTTKKWYTFIENRLADIYERLPLPTALKNLSIIRCRIAAMQLFSWIMQQDMFNISPVFAYNLLTPPDWTVEMRLDEKKIAERLVKDDRIPVYDRYRMACFHCLEPFIQTLWNQSSPERRKDFFGPDQCQIVKLWSNKLVGRLEEFIANASFWDVLLDYGVKEGSTSTVIQCWGELHKRIRLEIFINTAIDAVLEIYLRIDGDYFSNLDQISPAPYTDILCFLLTQMSKRQRVAFFRTILQLSYCNVLECFIKWPYMDLLIPIIKEIWDFLPEEKYEDLLSKIAYNCSNEIENIRIHDYIDNDYGSLMIELLEEAPDHFKRYIFRDNYQTDTNTFDVGKIQFSAINQQPLKIRNIKTFQHIWQHVTLEEKRSFLRSKYGEKFCCHLALEEHWELLNATLSECLFEDDIAEFKKNILRSESGKYLCFEMLTHVNEMHMNSLLNWGFPSKQDIFPFLLTIFFRDNKYDSKEIRNCNIEIDCLDNVIKTYSPSVCARIEFKIRFVEIYSKDICFHFLTHSKMPKVNQFLIWAFPSTESRKRYKNWFVQKYATHVCQNHIFRRNLRGADQFLTWCCPTGNAVEQFRQHIFSSLRENLHLYFMDDILEYLDSLMKLFRLSPEITLEVRKEVLLHPSSLDTIFQYMSNLEKCRRNTGVLRDALQGIPNILRWGLSDEEALMKFKYESEIHFEKKSFFSTATRQRIQRNWEKLISDRLSDLSYELGVNYDLVTLFVVIIFIIIFFAVKIFYNLGTK